MAFLARLARWSWRHKVRSLAAVFALGFLLLNALAFMHARAMTHFTAGGGRTARPEALSIGQKVHALFLGVTIPRPESPRTPAELGLDFKVRHIPVADGTDLEAWYVPHCEPRGLVVLFHSYAACKSQLLPEARMFHELGHAALLVDFRGSGGSSGNATTVGVREADDVAAAAEHARALCPGRPLILYGQSMGSAAILRAVAVGGVTADAAILECPFDRLLSTVGNRFTAMGLPAFPAAHLLVFWGGVQNHFNGFAHNPGTYARDVRCPVLLMHGTADPRVSRAQAADIFENLAGEKEFVPIEGAGHEPCLAAEPERWTEAVRAFLRQRDRGAP